MPPSQLVDEGIWGNELAICNIRRLLPATGRSSSPNRTTGGAQHAGAHTRILGGRSFPTVSHTILRNYPWRAGCSRAPNHNRSPVRSSADGHFRPSSGVVLRAGAPTGTLSRIRRARSTWLAPRRDPLGAARTHLAAERVVGALGVSETEEVVEQDPGAGLRSVEFDVDAIEVRVGLHVDADPEPVQGSHDIAEV